MPEVAERTGATQPTLFWESGAPSTNGAGLEQVETFRRDSSSDCLVRVVRTRDAEDEVESLVPACDGAFLSGENLRADYDASWLRSDFLPNFDEGRGVVSLVDLFSGCGGMSAGVAEAARALGLYLDPILAVDKDHVALEVFKENFPGVETRATPVEELFGLEHHRRFDADQRRLKRQVGTVDILLGGPPCQGHSNLNNSTRRNDPKNALFFTLARAAALLRPRHVVVENVRDIVYDEDDVFRMTRNYFEDELDYSVDTGLVKAERFGVPQHRHRMFLVASRETEVSIARMVAPFLTVPRTFHWACGDLDGSKGRAGFDKASQPHEQTMKRIDWLHDNEAWELPEEHRPPCHRDGHTYPGVYGRMWEDEPAPTITTGFPYMGQGRFVHPTERRTITPHEAARLQFFPDRFEFGKRSRAAFKRLIGNAVPPKLTYVLALQLLR